MSQREKLKEFLADGKPHTSIQILAAVYGGEHKGIARIASRINELRDEGCIIESGRGKLNKSIWYYQWKNAPGRTPEPKKMVGVEYVIRDGVRYAKPIYK